MDALDTNSLLLWRSLERLLALAVAAGCIYLGYRLFWSVRDFTADGEGRLELPGGISLYVTRVGPGVFFALFGTAIIGFSITQPLALSQGIETPRTGQTAQAIATAGTHISYAVDAPEPASFSQQQATIRRQLRALQPLQPYLEAQLEGRSSALSDHQATQLLIALPHLRKQLLLAGWNGNAWGKPAAFEVWLREDGQSVPQGALAEPVRLYLGRVE